MSEYVCSEKLSRMTKLIVPKEDIAEPINSSTKRTALANDTIAAKHPKTEWMCALNQYLHYFDHILSKQFM